MSNKRKMAEGWEKIGDGFDELNKKVGRKKEPSKPKNSKELIFRQLFPEPRVLSERDQRLEDSIAGSSGVSASRSSKRTAKKTPSSSKLPRLPTLFPFDAEEITIDSCDSCSDSDPEHTVSSIKKEDAYTPETAEPQSPVEITESLSPVQTAESGSPVFKDSLPSLRRRAQTRVEQEKGAAPLRLEDIEESEDDVPLQHYLSSFAMKACTPKKAESQSPAEIAESQSPVEIAESQSPVETAELLSPVEIAVSLIPVETAETLCSVLKSSHPSLKWRAETRTKQEEGDAPLPLEDIQEISSNESQIEKNTPNSLEVNIMSEESTSSVPTRQGNTRHVIGVLHETNSALIFGTPISLEFNIESEGSKSSISTQEESTQAPNDPEFNIETEESTTSIPMQEESIQTPNSLEFNIESEKSTSSIPTGIFYKTSDTSPNITQASSASTSKSHGPDPRPKVKASEWLKTLDFKTTSKKPPANPPHELQERAKKKTYPLCPQKSMRYALVRRQYRKRSEKAMLRHEQETAALGPGPTADLLLTSRVTVMTLRIDSVLDLFSMQLGVCARVEEVLGTPTHVIALFLHEMSLQEGGVAQVFPPWQQITLKDCKEKIQLCDNYRITYGKGQSDTRSIGQGSSSGHDDDITEKEVSSSDCPCVTGKTRDPCPIKQEPDVPCAIIDEFGNYASGEEELPGMMRIPVPSNKFLRHLLTKKSLPEWYYCTHPAARFVGTVLHVFRHMHYPAKFVNLAGLKKRMKECPKKDPVPELRFSVLVEDQYDMVGEFLCPKDAEVHFPDLIQHGIGQKFMIGGLKAESLIRRDNTDSTVFSMIERLQNVQAQTDRSKEPTELCFFMREVDNFNVEARNDGHGPLELNTNQITLLADLTPSEQRIRVSICCTVLFSLHLSKDKVSFAPTDMRRAHKAVLYVQDQSSNDHSYVTMTTTKEFHQQPGLSRKTWIFSHVEYVSGMLFCDKYTQVTQQDATLISDLQLSPFHGNLSPLDLCTVSGRICEIHSDSFSCREVCKRCRQGYMGTITETQQQICLNCEKIGTESISKMTLRVTLFADPSSEVASSGHVTQPQEPGTRVSVQLLNRTVKKILRDDPDPDQGYRADSEVNLGPLSCVVLSTNGPQIMLKEVYLDNPS